MGRRARGGRNADHDASGSRIAGPIESAHEAPADLWPREALPHFAQMHKMASRQAPGIVADRHPAPLTDKSAFVCPNGQGPTPRPFAVVAQNVSSFGHVQSTPTTSVRGPPVGLRRGSHSSYAPPSPFP